MHYNFTPVNNCLFLSYSDWRLGTLWEYIIKCDYNKLAIKWLYIGYGIHVKILTDKTAQKKT